MVKLSIRAAANAAKITTAYQLVKATGLSMSAGYALWAGSVQRIEFHTLDILCQAFNCQPGDILVYANGKRAKSKK